MFSIQFETDNDAFKKNESAEVMRILKTIISDLRAGSETNGVCDINGNRVGGWELIRSWED